MRLASFTYRAATKFVIAPVSKTGLLCDSTSPSGLRIRGSIAPVFSVVYVLLLSCSDGEVVRYLWEITLRVSCAAIGFLSVPGWGCDARCSLRHRSNPSLGLAGLRPAHARDAASPLHGRCRHGFLCHTAVTIRGASAIPAHHVQKPSPSHLHRPAGDVLRGGAVSWEPRTHPY